MPAIFLVIVALVVLAVGLVLWKLLARGRKQRSPSLPVGREILCEPGQLLGPATPGLTSVIVPAREQTPGFGEEPGPARLAMVCPLGHRKEIVEEILQWGERLVLFQFPLQGPCEEGHPEPSGWGYRMALTLAGGQELSSEVVYLASREGTGYPVVPSLWTSETVDLTHTDKARTAEPRA